MQVHVQVNLWLHAPAMLHFVYITNTVYTSPFLDPPHFQYGDVPVYIHATNLTPNYFWVLKTFFTR